MKPDTKADPKVYLVAQELELVRLLAGNDPKTRDKTLKNLSTWFLRRLKTIPFTEEDFQKIWKGLFYCMWMSDKPLVQEDCAEKISKLVHFPDLATSLMFFKAGLFILGQEWTGVDQLRLDKFLMLIRRLLREVFRALQQHSFKEKNIKSFNKVLLETILISDFKISTGLFMHFNEIFLEELAKVTEGKIHSKSIVSFLQPFIQCLAKLNDGRKIGYLKKFIFWYLMRQSDVGLDYQEKYEAWKQQGFPGSINSMQKVKVDEDKNVKDLDKKNEKISKEKPLDPRAGRVDVEIPQIRFNAHEVANALLEYKFDENSSSQSRIAISSLAKQFIKLANGVYPLGIKRIDVNDKNEDINIRKAANRLIKFEQKLMGKERKRKRDKKNSNKAATNAKRIKLKINEDNSATDKKIESKKDMNSESSINLKKLKTTHASPINVANKSKKSKIESLKALDNNKNTNNIVIMKNKLKSKKDENVIKKNQKTKLDLDIECMFKRNSGTWVVFEIDSAVPTSSQQISGIKEENIVPTKSSEVEGKNNFEVSNFLSDKSATLNDWSSESDLNPVNLFESPPEETKELFPKSEWDEPLQKGEYEFCFPAKKYIEKLKKQARNKNKNVHELNNIALKKIKGKSRLSLDSQLVNNPFSMGGSTKKVKINTKLNKSQEIYEHIRNVKSSPAIPYDASKKPSKPLLKPSAMSTPINPFYLKKLRNF